MDSMMKSLSARLSRISSRTKTATLVGILAFTLAASPLTAHAILAKEDTAEPSTESAASTNADESQNAPTQGEVAAKTTSLTVYYCEIIPFDETIDHPSNMRLIKTETFDGLAVGEQFEPWDYVQDLDGYMFFDGWSENYTLSENPDENNLQLHYMATQNNSATVNYYIMSKGQETDGVTYQSLDSDQVDINGDPVRFTKLGEYQLDNLRFNRFVEGADHAVLLDNLMFVDSFPSSIQVTTSPEDNVINLLYTPTLTTLPDDVLAGSDENVQPPVSDDEGDDDSTTGGEGDDDSITGGAGDGADDEVAGDAGNNNTTGSAGDDNTVGGTGESESTPTPNPGTTTETAGDTAAQSSSAISESADTLPQTGDSLGILIVAAIFVASSAATILIALYRKSSKGNNKA